LKFALLAGVSALGLASPALAGPEGGTVVAGTATISTPAPTTTQIDQASDKAIINWNSFNVGANESAVFNQPNAASVTLNRIFDQNASVIAG
jgi:large exoprotein involved in heme utilization and adhesion